MLNALRCIDNPYDDVAFFGVLRSGLIGLDDNALMRIADALDPPYFPGLMETANGGRSKGPQAALAGLSEDERDAIQFAVGMLGDLHRRKDALGIDAIIGRILEATGYEAMLLSQFQGKRMAGNVRMLTEQARSAVAGGASLAEFIAQTGEQVLSESRYEQAAVSGESENVVRLMTIHKAKGLEFPVVFVPDLNAGRRRAGGVLLDRSDWGLTYGLRSDRDDRRDGDCETPLSYRLARRREDADEQAEDVRKLYVAATRAEDHLVFVGADWRTREGLLREGDSYLRKMDEALGITDALDAGSKTIPYDDDRYSAVVRSLAPSPAPRGRESVPRGERLLAEATTGAQLAGAIVASASPASPPALLGPLPTADGRVELAVTALSEFEHCPMLYRWRYELRIPGQVETGGAAGGAGASLDPATMGTLYHRCMELLDFARPQTAGELVRRAVGELGLQESADVAEIEGELEDMVATLRAHPLGKALEGAKRTLRELDFIMRSGPAMLRGQIDLLYQDADGRWCVVDYKSDRVSADNLPDHARRYELQLLTYASAAARYLDELPTVATLYFLRPGTTHAFPIGADALSATQARIAELAAQLVAARRSGQFERRQSAACDFCPYGKLCVKLRSN